MSTPTKTIYLCRHAQAFHNVAGDYSLHDPGLTPLGLEQCSTVLARYFPHAIVAPSAATTGPEEQEDLGVPSTSTSTSTPFDLIVTSPLRRTLQTTLHAFGPLLKPHQSASRIPMYPLADLQETGDLPCDTGSSLEHLIKWFPDVDFRHLDPEWYKNKNAVPAGDEEDKAISMSELDEEDSGCEEWERLPRLRVRRVLRWLMRRPENRIMVVSHGGFLKALTREVDVFENVQVKKYELGGDRRLRLSIMKEWKSEGIS
ncbi:hypothetical protein HK102_013552 [Quaeritorhiza haematococci]|nr:hypothetical protein HK102_013552 [Quaeritorhiza haematococci]